MQVNNINFFLTVVSMRKDCVADTKRFRMVMVLLANDNTSDVVHNSAFHNAFRLQVSWKSGPTTEIFRLFDILEYPSQTRTDL